MSETELLNLWLQQVSACLFPVPDVDGVEHPCGEAALDEGEMCAWCRTVRWAAS